MTGSGEGGTDRGLILPALEDRRGGRTLISSGLDLANLRVQRLEHPIRRDRYPQYPAGMAIYVPERYQDDHLDRYVAGPLSRGNVDRDHLAGEGQDGTGFRGYGADLGGKPSFPDLRVRRLA